MWNNSNYSKKTTCSEEFIDIYIQDLSIRKKATHTAVSPDFPIIDLIFNYDLSKLRVQHYSFNEADDVTENDQFIYIRFSSRHSKGNRRNRRSRLGGSMLYHKLHRQRSKCILGCTGRDGKAKPKTCLRFGYGKGRK